MDWDKEEATPDDQAVHPKPARTKRRQGDHQDSISNGVVDDGDSNDNDDDEDESFDAPGAIRIPGINSSGVGPESGEAQTLTMGTTSSVANELTSRPSLPTMAVVEAELVPENDTVKEENERLREELQREREERGRQQQQQQQQVVIAGAAEPIDERKFKYTVWLYVGIAILFVGVGVAVGVTVGLDPTPESEPTNTQQQPVPTMKPSTDPTLMPSVTPTANPTKPPRLDLFLESFLTNEPRLNATVLTNTTSPQYRALAWLADEDELVLEPVPFSTLTFERFILVTLFFATDGFNWANEFRFLRTSSICEWNNGVDWANDGVRCNEKGFVSKIYMGKVFDCCQPRTSQSKNLFGANYCVHIPLPKKNTQMTTRL